MQKVHFSKKLLVVLKVFITVSEEMHRPNKSELDRGGGIIAHIVTTYTFKIHAEPLPTATTHNWLNKRDHFTVFSSRDIRFS